MSAFEKIVRPYQAPEITPPKITFAAGGTETDAPVHLKIGVKGGSPKTLQGTNSLSSTVYVIRKPKEKKQD